MLSSLNGTYVIDPSHSEVGFSARHAMATKVRGTFDEFAGEATLKGDDPSSSSVNVTVQMDSIDTRNADRDAHLRTNDFFSIETYPTMTFTSTKVEVQDDTTALVTGDLTIKGVTKSVTIPFEFTGAATDPFGNERVGFEGSTSIDREDFGVTWNAPLETGGVLVSKKIGIDLAISAIKQA